MDNDHDHYRMYLRIYGLMLIMAAAADDDELVRQLVRGEAEGAMMQAVRERIEDSPRY